MQSIMGYEVPCKWMHIWPLTHITWGDKTCWYNPKNMALSDMQAMAGWRDTWHTTDKNVRINIWWPRNHSTSVKGFTPLGLTWAVLVVMDWCVFALASTRGLSQQGEAGGSDGDGMNLVGIEEHQVRDLVFAQVHYLNILLKATSACVIVPIAKVPQTQYSN